MTPAEILIHLRDLDVELSVDGESLRYSAPAGVMTPTMKDMLQQNKPLLVKMLRDAHHWGYPMAPTVTMGSPLVALRTSGPKRPIFFVHPSGGTVYCYVELAQSMDRERPFYAFQSLCVDGRSDFPSTVEEMARAYLAPMLAVQPRGPYLIGAWSFGGTVAFEMAQQLLARGESIALLAMIDTPGPGFLQKSADDVALLVHLLRIDLPISLDALRAVGTPEQQLMHVVEEAKRVGVYDAGLTTEQVRHFLRIHQVNNRAAREYRPSPYSGRISFFRPTAEDASGFLQSPEDPTLGWRRWAAGGLDLHWVPGGHLDVLSKPFVQTLADQLSRLLKKATEA